MTAYENTGEESRLEEIQRTSEASTCNAMFPWGFCSNRSVYRHYLYQVNSSSSRSWRREGIRRAKGAFVSESALHSFDGDKPNSVPSTLLANCWAMIIHLSRISPRARRIFIRRNATIPEDSIGPAALPLFCLAPHGVFRASRIAPRAVSSYLAFSPLPALFSKNRRCLFCDTFRHRNFSTAAPAYFTRHAAVWCSDFPPVNPAGAGLTSDHLPSARNLAQDRQPGSRRP